MSQDENIKIAQAIFKAIAAHEDPEAISKHFAEDVVLEIQGDEGALPWIGRQVGRRSIADFIRGTRQLITQESVEVDDILASESRAVVVGRLATVINETRRRFESDFAFVMTIKAGIVTRFQMLEDSFAVANAARA